MLVTVNWDKRLEVNGIPSVLVLICLWSFILQWRMDVEREEETDPQRGWEWVKTQEEKLKKEKEEVCSDL